MQSEGAWEFVPIPGSGSGGGTHPRLPLPSLAGALAGKKLSGVRCNIAFCWELPLQPPATAQQPLHVWEGGIPVPIPVPVPIPCLQTSPLHSSATRCCQRQAGKLRASPGWVWRKKMEQSPKKLCRIWGRSKRLEGSKAPGRDAAGEGSGVLGDPCAHRVGVWGAANPAVCGEASGDLPVRLEGHDPGPDAP